jgi:hypothetical protein
MNLCELQMYEPVTEGSYIKMIDMVSGQGGQIQVSTPRACPKHPLDAFAVKGVYFSASFCFLAQENFIILRL